MSSTTPNLQLYKANPVTDANNTFNIDTVLNNNWDKIDDRIGSLLGSLTDALLSDLEGYTYDDLKARLDELDTKFEYGISIKGRRVGAKGNANYFNSTDGKWYQDAGFTTLANDDLAAIQTAITNIGGTLRVPKGNFYCSATLSIGTTKTKIQGLDKELSKLVFPRNTQGVSVDVSLVTIENLSIYSPDYATSGTGISIKENINGIIIDGCRVENFYANIKNRGLGCTDIEIRNTELVNGTYYNIHFIRVQKSKIINTNIKQTKTGTLGIRMSGCSQCEIIGTNVYGGGFLVSGIFIGLDSEGFQDSVYANTVDGCKVYDTTEEGITFDLVGNLPANNKYMGAVAGYNNGVIVNTTTNNGFLYQQALITHGKARGTFQRINYVASYNAGTQLRLQLDYAPRVVPDTTSRVSVRPVLWLNKIVNCYVKNTGRTGILFYGAQVGSIIANNTVDRMGKTTYANIGVIGMASGDQEAPNFSCSVTGNAVRGGGIGISLNIDRFTGDYADLRSAYHTINGNTIQEADYAFDLDDIEDCEIAHNTVTACNNAGSFGANTNNNRFVYNKIVNVNTAFTNGGGVGNQIVA